MFDDRFYQDYVRHLPQASLGTLERGRLYHVAHQHDDWCRIFVTGKPLDCDCNVVITCHEEPRRS